MMDGDARAGIGAVCAQALPAEGISYDETCLAEKLRRLCDRFGIERKEKLEDSADVLFSLGKLYFEKAQVTKDMPQKLTYIRCSALLNGAKVRFKMMKDYSKISEVDEVLVKLHSHILHSAGVTGVGGEEIFEFSIKLLKDIQKMREDAKQRIANIPVMNDGGNRAKEKKKIAKVQFENLQLTEQYLNLVKKISKKVEELIGAPPCKFAIVGLGSLARQEITLYSDFEHVIILDDEVQQKNDDEYQEIQEYFRWFAVVFQAIVIEFGETFIPSVCVRSLNDHYTDDRSKNWFYDAYTPCGIAFDGMVPHSCNTPLGRQQATENRKHAVELIQPASEMAKFLTHDAKIKNGYYLHDILTSTCFVYGNDEVYKVYLREARQILESLPPDYILRQEEKKVDKNCVEPIRNMYYSSNNQRRYDMKAELYRPIITLLGCYARINAISDECASFRIISRLHGDGIISSDFAHELEYAVAVACGTRLQIYASSESERNAITMREFAAFVGEDSAIRCNEVISDLRVEIAVKTNRHNSRLSTLTKLTQKAKNLMMYGCFQKAIACSEKIIAECEDINQLQLCSPSNIISTILFAKYIMQICYLELATTENQRSDEYFRQCEKVSEDMLRCDDESILGRCKCAHTLTNLYMAQNRHQEYVKAFELWKRYYNMAKSQGKISSHLSMFFMRVHDFKVRQRITGWDKILEHLQSELEEEDEKRSKYLLRCYIAVAHIRLGQLRTGRKELLQVLTEIIQDARQIRKSEYIVLLRTIGVGQAEHEWKYDLSITLLEENQAMQSSDRAGDEMYVHLSLSDQQKKSFESIYKEYCQWRKEHNLPLEYSKLNVWDEYEKMSPYLKEDNPAANKSNLPRSQIFETNKLNQMNNAVVENLMRYKLRDPSKFYVKTLFIKGRGRLVSGYNEAADNLYWMKIPEAAAGLWEIMQNGDEKKRYVWRRAVELMFFMLHS